MIEFQIDRFKRADREATDALHELKRLTLLLKDALVRGELRRFGELLHDAFVAKKHMNPRAVPENIERLYEIGRANGAVGGKILGAGGGGYMLFFCDFRRKHEVARALEKAGGKVVDFDFVEDGVQTWFLRLSESAPSLVPKGVRFATPPTT